MMIKNIKQNKLIIAGKLTKPSKPSVKFTALEVPTITKVMNNINAHN